MHCAEPVVFKAMIIFWKTSHFIEYSMDKSAEISPDAPEDHKEAKTYKSPYEVGFFSRMLFFYMNPAMTLANERAKEGKALGGTSSANVPSRRHLQTSRLRIVRRDLHQVLDQVRRLQVHLQSPLPHSRLYNSYADHSSLRVQPHSGIFRPSLSTPDLWRSTSS